MLFSSITFLFFFLPIILAAHLCAGARGRNVLLLAGSILFYFWGEQLFVFVLIASAIINYFFGLLISRRGKTEKLVLAVAVAVNLGLLGFFKYANFIIANFNALLTQFGIEHLVLEKVHLPIGISFFTFEALSYLIDIYRQKYPAQKNPLYIGLYFSLFPRLIAGPIVRYNDIAEQIKQRTITLTDFAAGAERFIFGLGKKVLIANSVGQLADQIFTLPADTLSIGTAWLGVLCYSLQIYFDFSGYSDMAIGLGRMFGFHLLENFNYPYISRSVREFWRRWHMSLSTWLRDYLYIPLGGNRHGALRTGFNLLIVFLLCGLWHGASWNFILWGLLYGVFLVVERGRFGKMLDQKHPLWQHIYTLFVIGNGWVLFRLERLADVGSYFAAMYGFAKADAMLPQISMRLDSRLCCSLAAGIILSAPLYPWLRKNWQPTTAILALPAQTIKLLLITAVLLYSAASLAVNSYNPFIYFRF
ncbi:MBOAT family protein [Desulfobulbus sp. F5]|nr:MBOAT family protein [Desulfobulbus sp. F5]